MKTAISIPESIFREAERLARRLGKSRSQLDSEAIAAYVRRWDPDEVTQAIDAALEKHPSGERAGFVARAARRTLRRSAW
jgi:metal-responsive CopG/Arc/MetJ family transcriptional regulator